MDSKGIRHKINAITGLNSEQKSFLLKYYKNGKNLRKTVPEADYMKWYQWLRYNKALIAKIDNSKQLISSIQQAYDYCLNTATRTIKKLEQSGDVIRSASGIASMLRIVMDCTGLSQHNTSLQISINSEAKEDNPLSKLTDEQLAILAKLASRADNEDIEDGIIVEDNKLLPMAADKDEQ